MENVTEIKFKVDEFRVEIGNLRRNMRNHIEMIKLLAKLRKEKYDAHISEGFTEEEALEICKGDV